MTARTPGRRLRADLDQVLEHASKQAGYRLEWSEQEKVTIAAAADMADRIELLTAMFDQAESTSAKLKVVTELRQHQRQLIELVNRVNPGDGTPRSQRHVRAAQQRWSNHRRNREA